MSSKFIAPHQLQHASANPSTADAGRLTSTPPVGSSRSPLGISSQKSVASQTRPAKRRTASAHTTLSAHGAPLVWLTGGSSDSAVMIIGLLALVLYQGLQTFWPQPVVQLEVTTDSGSGPSSTLLGEIARTERFCPDPSLLDELKLHAGPLYKKAQAEMKSHDGTLRAPTIVDRPHECHRLRR